jgi:hypothetical protein
MRVIPLIGTSIIMTLFPGTRENQRSTYAATGAAAGAATGGIIGALSQQAGISDEEANVYAEGLRRGGALVSAKVDDADAARVQAIMDRSSVRIADRAAAYRKSGWTTYDPMAKPYTRDEVLRERSLYR